jgi:O-antigen ligase
MEPSLILIIAIPVIIIFFILAWKSPLYIFFIHVSSRVILDGVSHITYKSVFLSMSIMQIYSLFFMIFLGLYLYFKKVEIEKSIPLVFPILLICLSYILSGIVSNEWLPIIEGITKWIYMIFLAGLVFLILHYHKLNHLMLVFWISVLPAVFIQFYAILTNNYSIAAGGHFAYYGGYDHQFMLSYILLAFIATSLYLSIYYKNLLLKLFFILSTLYGIFAIYLCGYRTSYLALAVFLLFVLISYLIKSNIPKKILAVYLFSFITIFIIYVVGSDLALKLNDVWIFFRSPFIFFDFSGNPAYIKMFSGRIYIINILMGAYLSSPFEAIVFGMGIDSSRQLIGTYPHNEFLSALVETGILGFSVFILFIVFYLRKILNNIILIKKLEDFVIIGLGIGLIVMTLATMPFRCMRAMILFGVILGVMNYKNRMIKTEE